MDVTTLMCIKDHILSRSEHRGVGRGGEGGRCGSGSGIWKKSVRVLMCTCVCVHFMCTFCALKIRKDHAKRTQVRTSENKLLNRVFCAVFSRLLFKKSKNHYLQNKHKQ